MSEKVIGKVLWFDDAKGFGFINVPNRVEDVFVHYTGIETVGKNRRTLHPDQEVSFEIVQGNKGPQAQNVKVLS